MELWRVFGNDISDPEGSRVLGERSDRATYIGNYAAQDGATEEQVLLEWKRITGCVAGKSANLSTSSMDTKIFGQMAVGWAN